MKPKIDILLPYWGDFKFFKETVDSVLAQTNQNWRLTVYDDAYPSDKASKYIQKVSDSRIVYFRHEKNIGITANFNFAVRNATAPYCCVIGCDDVLLPNYVEQALSRIGSATFYQPGVIIIDKNSNPYLPLADRVKRLLRPKKSGIYSGEGLAISLCQGNWLYFPSIVWKTSTLKQYEFNEKFKIAEDVVVELNMIIDGHDLYLDNGPTFLYRRFSESLSSKEKGKSGVRFNEEDEVYEYFAKKFKAKGWHKAARTAKLRLTSRIHRLIG